MEIVVLPPVVVVHVECSRCRRSLVEWMQVCFLHVAPLFSGLERTSIVSFVPNSNPYFLKVLRGILLKPIVITRVASLIQEYSLIAGTRKYRKSGNEL